MKKICPVCQVEFETGGRAGKRAQIYCSRNCSSRAQSHETPCLECGVPCKKARKYCSRECYFAARSREVSDRIREFTCAKCGKQFRRYVSLRRGHATFCSNECRETGRVYKTGPDHPSWKGGTFLRNGYEWQIDPERRRRFDGHYLTRATHVIVAEQTLGRALEKGEHVHHRNGIRLDNRPENLLVLDAKRHRALHAFYAESFVREHYEKGDLDGITDAFLASLG